MVYYERLRAEPLQRSPLLWKKMAACQQVLGNEDGAVKIYHDALQGNPELVLQFAQQ